jgi:dimethylhistidine N-methyltransferase
MTPTGQAPTRELIDLSPAAREVRAAVLDGLTGARKTLPCKLLYDERGSQWFERICDLDEYYPTRTELSIMRDHVHAMAEAIGPDAAVIEYGSGSSTKSRLLLEHLHAPAAYIPIEISRQILLESCRALRRAFAPLRVVPVCADYTKALRLPDLDVEPRRRVVYFPGSTIGNFHPHEAQAFLARSGRLVGDGGGMLLGVDLIKDRPTLEAAYDDREGVTAAFNLNLLHRINRELGAAIDVDRFEHRAVFNPEYHRVEMHLVSKVAQKLEIAGATIDFDAGESIHTECSYKYTLAEFATLAAGAGWAVRQVWTDAQEKFSVQWLARKHNH